MTGSENQTGLILISDSILMNFIYIACLSTLMWTYIFEMFAGQTVNAGKTDDSIFTDLELSQRSLKHNIYLVSFICFYNLVCLLQILNNFFFHDINILFISFSKAKKDIMVYFVVTFTDL